VEASVIVAALAKTAPTSGGSAANSALAQASAAELENARLLCQAELAADNFQIQGLDASRQLLEAAVKAYEQYI
jgi:outer membrane protein TolC